MMKSRIKTSKEGYAILRATPIGESSLVLTEKCPFCGMMHTHVNPKKDDRGDIPLRRSHCVDKSLVGISENGLSVGNHIYSLEVIEEVKQ